MSASNVQHAVSTPDWPLGLPYDEPSSLSVADSGIDDPVNDTGRGPLRGDLQLPDEFARLLSMICERSGDFS